MKHRAISLLAAAFALTGGAYASTYEELLAAAVERDRDLAILAIAEERAEIAYRQAAAKRDGASLRRMCAPAASGRTPAAALHPVIAINTPPVAPRPVISAQAGIQTAPLRAVGESRHTRRSARFHRQRAVARGRRGGEENTEK